MVTTSYTFIWKFNFFWRKKLNKNKNRFLKGAFLTLLLSIGTFLFFFICRKFITNNIIRIIFDAIFLFYALANKSLIEEGKAVFTALKKGITQGRNRVAWIVGRDTSKLNKQEIIKAVFETLSENLSDGVIAPLFYFAILGVPGAMLYKMVNTFDSMIGYKNERYINFGKFAAKLDDVLNYIPSRLTAILMLLVTFSLDKIGFVWQQGKNHSSPNAGYPEAALATILNCRFGGPNYYHGKLVHKPFIGNNNRIIKEIEFKKVAFINHSVTLTFVLLIGLITYFLF
ncbi:adenosylcobinamide-phosphate synthase CbiB [Tenacibaculum pacificus]|nr:adenosylcobinamide-phosphate synthase CbiB [Tenacibaculum pacificus]WBX74582.1 adenosylcobinamide-phosphate synthase CbiB [Tenacibaculum pacificus]